MPMIRGRYYINPAVGEALEQARSLGEGNFQNQEVQYENGPEEPAHDEGGRFRRGHSDERDAHHGPIHRVEIERAELGSNAGGRGSGGFLARVHRQASSHSHDDGYPGEVRPAAFPPRPSVHVFTDHNDLADFLRNELSREQ